jgi:DNA polymerase IV
LSTALRRILHVDVDSMFVRCAMLADPRLADEELILVGGRPEGRGVVASASYGCRAYGVRSAMPMATALRLCPAAIIVPAPREMIRQKSRELEDVLRAWAPVASMASVDEAYLDLTGTELLYRGEPLAETARRIQAAVREQTQLDVSIGGGTNRFIAKLATTHRAKPRRVYTVEPGQEAAFVSGLELGDLIGVGPAMLTELRRRGVTTMQALRALELATLREWWGDERARWLWQRCRGIDLSAVTDDDTTKSVSSETTFARDLATTAELEAALLEQTVRAAAALRRKALFARTITVKLRTSDFRDHSRSRTLEESVQTERAIFPTARALLAELREKTDASVRLIGIALTKLSDLDMPVQASLVDLAPPIEADRDRAIARATDRLREKFGTSALRPGRLVAPPGEPE